MSELEKARGRYKVSRAALLLLIILFIAYSLFIAFSKNTYVLSVLVLPQLALAYARYYFSGLQAFLIIALFVIFPLIEYIICYILSSEDYHWMIPATIMMSIDVLVEIWFILMNNGLSYKIIISMLAEIILHSLLLMGCFTGHQLKDDFKKKKEEQSLQEEQEELIPLQSSPVQQEETIYYKYDRPLAKENHASKMKEVLIVIAAYLVIVMVGFFGLAILESSIQISTAVFVILLSLIGLLPTLWFVLKMIQYNPYISAREYRFCVIGGVVCRENLFNREYLHDLEVLEHNESEYVCQYTDHYGKTRKIIIPKCYKNIDDIL